MGFGLWARSRVVSSGEGAPVSDVSTKRRQIVGSKRPHEVAAPERRRVAALTRGLGAPARGEEEVRRPDLLERSGLRHGCATRRCRRGRGQGGLREERVGEVVPRDRGDHAVDAPVGAGQHQGEGTAVGRTHDPGPGVAPRVELDIGAGGRQVEQRLGVGDLVRRVVEVDPAAGAPMAPGAPRHDHVPTVVQRGGLRDHGVLGAAEPVGQQDDRVPPRVLRPHGHVERHRRAVRLGRNGDAGGLRRDRLCREGTWSGQGREGRPDHERGDEAGPDRHAHITSRAPRGPPSSVEG